MKHLAFITLIVLFTQCATTRQQREDNRVARKIEKIKRYHPTSFENLTIEVLRIDTVIKEIVLAGVNIVDTVEIEKFLEVYLVDTVQVPLFIKEFIKVAADTTQVDTLGIHLTITGVAVAYSLVKDETHITAEKKVETITITKTEVVNKVPWYYWTLVIGLMILAIFAFIRR